MNGHENGHDSRNLSSGRHEMALTYSSSCVMIQKDVKPTETVEMGATQSAIANGSATSLGTSKASLIKRANGDSCCDAGGLDKPRQEIAANGNATTPGTSKASLTKGANNDSCCDVGGLDKPRQEIAANGSATSPGTSKASVTKRTNGDSCCDAGGLNKPRQETAATSKASVRKRTSDEVCCDVGISNKRRHESAATSLPDERVLILVARHTKWNPLLLSFLSCVCKKTCAISNRILWREFCLSRAPRMVSDLLLGGKEGRIDGGWNALGKLFLYCAGSHCRKSSGFHTQKIAGHFVPKTRFSCTAGRSFLIRRCWMDVLYMSDPCEHANDPEDVGVFRGVFKGFDKSETKKLITNMRVQLEEEEKCPFCKAGVWSMRSAHMIPRSASTRLAAFNENVEYSVCLNGHVNGRCALLHLSDTDGSNADQ